MCRLLGIAATDNVNFEFSLCGDAEHNLGSQSVEHPDGWGIATFNQKPIPTIVKEPQKAIGDSEFETACRSSRGRILISHVRKATQGENIVENTHPFISERWVFAHNGTIEDISSLEGDISPCYKNQLQGSTDSERYFALILSEFKKRDLLTDADKTDLLDSLHAVIDKVRKKETDGLNFLLSDGNCLFAYREGVDLHLLETDLTDPGTIHFESEKTNAVVEVDQKESSVIIASEKITESKNWEEIPDRRLLCINKELKINRVDV